MFDMSFMCSLCAARRKADHINHVNQFNKRLATWEEAQTREELDLINEYLVAIRKRVKDYSQVGAERNTNGQQAIPEQTRLLEPAANPTPRAGQAYRLRKQASSLLWELRAWHRLAFSTPRLTSERAPLEKPSHPAPRRIRSWPEAPGTRRYPHLKPSAAPESGVLRV